MEDSKLALSNEFSHAVEDTLKAIFLLCQEDQGAGTTALPTQTVGDCKQVVCDGNGGTTTRDDDSDVPDDSNPCTLDGCDAGSPTHVGQGEDALPVR